jgi:hypothetical protein
VTGHPSFSSCSAAPPLLLVIPVLPATGFFYSTSSGRRLLPILRRLTPAAPPTAHVPSVVEEVPPPPPCTVVPPPTTDPLEPFYRRSSPSTTSNLNPNLSPAATTSRTGDARQRPRCRVAPPAGRPRSATGSRPAVVVVLNPKLQSNIPTLLLLCAFGQ